MKLRKIIHRMIEDGVRADLIVQEEPKAIPLLDIVLHGQGDYRKLSKTFIDSIWYRQWEKRILSVSERENILRWLSSVPKYHKGASFNLAQNLRNQGRYDEALIIIDQLIDEGWVVFETEYLRANIHFDAGAIAGLENTYRHLLSKYKWTKVPLYKIGMIRWLEGGDRVEAREYVAEAWRKDKLEEIEDCLKAMDVILTGAEQNKLPRRVKAEIKLLQGKSRLKFRSH
jgi:tetratricopeptide (TPR) repeat protein